LVRTPEFKVLVLDWLAVLDVDELENRPEFDTTLIAVYIFPEKLVGDVWVGVCLSVHVKERSHHDS
jgi:hypothetical protein